MKIVFCAYNSCFQELCFKWNIIIDIDYTENHYKHDIV